MFFRHASSTQTTARPLYGVNLGGWLMLEKWITPSLFTGLALDEYTLYSAASEATLLKIKSHMDSFVTRADFAWLKAQGINTVRLPVGYGVFGDEAPYTRTVQYVDKAFAWAEETGMRILLDLHTAPGSQNGRQESGRIGKVAWHTEEQNIIKTLSVISKLAKRYGRRKALLGFELLNEPATKVPKRKLKKYYQAAYGIIRHDCGTKAWVVMSDGFRPRRWKRVLRGPKYENVYIDTHQYQVFATKDKRLDLAGHVSKTLSKVRKSIARMAEHHPIIVGEWSVALDPRSLKGLNDVQKDGALWVYGGAQLIAYESSAAWFYWTYRTEGGGAWCFRECVEKGLLPDLRT